MTLEGRVVPEAITDAVEATLVAFTPRDLDDWSRTIPGDPGTQAPSRGVSQ